MPNLRSEENGRNSSDTTVNRLPSWVRNSVGSNSSFFNTHRYYDSFGRIIMQTADIHNEQAQSSNYYTVLTEDTYDSIADANMMHGMGQQISYANGDCELVPGCTIIIPLELVNNDNEQDRAGIDENITTYNYDR
jgi:hypothetical protein